MAKVEIAVPAKADIQEAFNWWSENRSAIQAAECFERNFEAIATLKSMPERCPRVSVSGLACDGVRHHGQDDL